MQEINCKNSVYFALFSLSGKTLSEEHLCSEASRQKHWEQLCEMKSLRGFHVLLNVCRGLCFHHNHRQENTVTHMRKRERECQSITGYIACCVVWKNFQKAAIEVAVENELRAVNLCVQQSPCQRLFISKPLKFCEQKRVIPVAA